MTGQDNVVRFRGRAPVFSRQRMGEVLSRQATVLLSAAEALRRGQELSEGQKDALQIASLRVSDVRNALNGR